MIRITPDTQKVSRSRMHAKQAYICREPITTNKHRIQHFIQTRQLHITAKKFADIQYFGEALSSFYLFSPPVIAK
jgi:hypothetical protein